MQKTKLIAFLLISATALSSCSKAQSAATTEKAAPSQSIASQSPEGDIYTMEYKLCGRKCDANTSQIVTWGKPTEIGIGYFDDRITQINTKLITSIEKGRGMQTYFMVKCKGTLPGIAQPVRIDRFVPAETYQNILVKSSGVDGKDKPIYGHVEIVSIKQIPRTPSDNPEMVAAMTLKAKIGDMYMTKPGAVNGYVTMKPDITPQQVEPITWQEGQPPQVIPVKTW